MGTEPDVFEGAMRIARVEYPGLDPVPYRERLEEFAAVCGEHSSGRGRRGLEQFNEVFFGRFGFHGNRDDYYDPRNSYLNDVIDRRTGIPITLAAVWCEVARRAGFRVEGVGFPGHFLARARLTRGEALVDCFHGRIVEREDCVELLDSIPPGTRPELSDAMFSPAGPREILLRMLNNLRRIHAGRGEFSRAIRWIDLSLDLAPDGASDHRERGVLWLRLEEFGRALADLERYLALSPGAPDEGPVREQCALLRKLIAQLN